MNLKRTRFQGQASYIVYFANNSIRLSDLNKIETVHSVMVTWHPYVSARNGPTQCNNCQIYGHGARNCFSPPRCMSCGGKHKTDECLVDTDPNMRRELKCCLCAGPHTSNDRNCPKRLEYINISVKAATKTSNKPPVPVRNPNFNNENFPPLRPVNPKQPFSRWFQPPSTSQNRSSLQPAISEQQENFSSHQTAHRAHHTTQSNDKSSNECLFTAEELLFISKELILALRSCRSKMDQFDAILSVGLKFGVYNV